MKLDYLKDRICYVLSRVRLFATPWTVASQDPLFMGNFMSFTSYIYEVGKTVGELG